MSRNVAVQRITDLAFPEIRAVKESGLGKGKLFLILAGAAIALAAFAVLFFTLQAKEQNTARHAGQRFASALVHDDPSLAPKGGDGYVKGVRSEFGAVTSARVIDAHNHVVPNSGQNDSRTYYQTDLLIEARRGPAVIELSFDNGALLASETISDVRELEPGKAKHISSAERAELRQAFAKRGGRPANDLALSGTMHTTAAARGGPNAVMRCVQGAGGDAAKLRACVQP